METKRLVPFTLMQVKEKDSRQALAYFRTMDNWIDRFGSNYSLKWARGYASKLQKLCLAVRISSSFLLLAKLAKHVWKENAHRIIVLSHLKYGTKNIVKTAEQGSQIEPLHDEEIHWNIEMSRQFRQPFILPLSEKTIRQNTFDCIKTLTET